MYRFSFPSVVSKVYLASHKLTSTSQADRPIPTPSSLIHPQTSKPASLPRTLPHHHLGHGSPHEKHEKIAAQLPSIWQTSTADSNLTLYSFSRFKTTTTHLFNLRCLEAEISQINDKIYKLGLQSNVAPTKTNRSGLEQREAEGDAEVLSQELIQRLRQLTKEYGMFITSFFFGFGD